MYQAFFGLRENPFSITPDTRYTYLSPQHEEALAHLLYGAYQHGSGGFALLTGEIGSGKTTLCRLLLERLEDETETIWILNPLLEPVDFLRACLEELGQTPAECSHYALYRQLNQHLLNLHAQGKRCLLIIDEAQLLTADTLELLRLLTNLETEQQKLLQVLLIGQPELLTRLEQADVAPLNQRITSRYHLQALDEPHAMAYLEHRVQQAGASRPLFAPAALQAIARAAGGIPRLLNIMADRALLVAYAQEEPVVRREHALQAIRECAGPERAPTTRRRKTRKLLLPGALLLALVLAAAGYPRFKQWWAGRQLPAPQTLAQVVQSLGGPPDVVHCQYELAADFHCLTLQRTPASLPAAAFPVFLPAQRPTAPLQGWLIHAFDPLELQPGHPLPSSRRGALMSQWRGDVLLLWQDPWQLPALIRPGESHPALRQLRAHWQLEPGDRLDATLQARLMQFQAAQGIPDDGILGPQTQFFLYRNRLLER